VTFLVGGIQLGAAQTVDALGNARINLNSDRGDAVPGTVSGQRVEVRTSAGALILSGSF
jgi:hypothetical protein